MKDNVYTMEVDVKPDFKGLYEYRMANSEGLVIYMGKATSPQTAWDEMWTILGP